MSYVKSSIVSIVVHVFVLAVVLGYAAIAGCLKKNEPEIINFTIAVEPSAEKEPEPVKTEHIAKPEPPLKKDNVAMEKPKPVSDKKPIKPVKQPKKIVKGKRVTRNVQSSEKPKEPQTLTDKQIQEWLKDRVKIGETTSLPKDDTSRQLSVLKGALDEAWQQPSRTLSGNGKAQVRFLIGAGGLLSNPVIVKSSGSQVFDKTVRDAVLNVGSVRGLSAVFIRTYSTITVEFSIFD